MSATAVAAPPKLRPPAHRASWSVLVLGGALASAGLLFAFNPADHALYPACWLYATTGLKCPGCGGLRATHELLHGHLTAAWTLNPLAVLLLPLWMLLGVHAGLTLLRGRGLPNATPRPALFWLAAAALVAFGILRNLPLR
jgi:hypothetical protein